jgi:hypothetical protein
MADVTTEGVDQDANQYVDFVDQQLEEAQLDELLRELELGRIANVGKNKAKREAQLEKLQDESFNPSRTESIPGIIRQHSTRLGITDQDLTSKLSNVGVDLNFFVDTVGRKGLSVDESKKLAADRGVEAFLAPDLRTVKARGRAIDRTARMRAPLVGKEIEAPGGFMNPSAARMSLSEERSGLAGTEIGDEEKVAKQGEFGAQLGFLILKQFKEAEDDDSKALLKTMEMYAEDPFQQGHYQFMKNRINQKLRTQDVSDLSNEERSDLDQKHLRAAVYDLAALKTAGLWTAPVFLPLDVDETGRWKLPTSGNYSVKNAFMPSIEIVGLSADGKQVIARQQGRLGTLFKSLDAIQGGIAGVMNREEGEELTQSALRGIAEGRTFLEEAMDSEFARKNAVTKTIAGVGGFGAMVLTPDLAVGLAGATKLGRAGINRVGAVHKNLKTAKRTIDDAENAVRHIADGIDNGNWDDYMTLETSLARSDSPDQRLIRGSLDLLDTEVAQAASRQYPELFDDAARTLDDRLPGEISGGLMSAHPSHRQAAFSVTDPTGAGVGETTISRVNRYDFGSKFDELAEARNRVQAAKGGDVEARSVLTRRAFTESKDEFDDIAEVLKTSKLSQEEQNALLRLVASRTQEGGLVRVVTKRITDAGDEVSKVTMRDVPPRYMLSEQLNQNVYTNVNWINETLTEMRRVLGADATGKAGGKRIQALQDALNGIKTKADDLATDEVFDDMLGAIDRAEELVKVNAESRGTAYVIVRDAVMDRFGIPKSAIALPGQRIERGIQELVEDATPESQRFVKALQRASPNMSQEEANLVGMTLDAVARAWAKKAGKDPTEWWKSRLKGIDLETANPQQVQKALQVVYNEGRATVKAFQEPTVMDSIEAIARVVRRDLDADDLDTVARWLSASGVPVRVTDGVLAPAFGKPTQQTLEDADDLIGKAFGSYLAGETAPTENLAHIFERMNQAAGSAYLANRQSVPDDVRNVFDKLLGGGLHPEGGAFSRIGRVISEELVGPQSRTQYGAVQELVSEATRKGVPLTLDEARKIEGKKTVVLKRPVLPESIAPRSAADIARGIQIVDEAAMVRLEKLLQRNRLLTEVDQPYRAARTAGDVFQEQSPAQKLRAIAADSEFGISIPGAAKLAATAFFGGDVYADLGLRKFPEVYRRAIMAAGRPIEEAIGDGIRLAAFNSREDFVDMLAGQRVEFKGGRVAPTSGAAFLDNAMLSIDRAFEGLSAEMQADLLALFGLVARAGTKADEAIEYVGRAGGKLDPDRTNVDEIIKALDRSFGRTKGGFFSDTLKAMQLTGGENWLTGQLQVLEHMLYLSGKIPRDKKLFSGDSVKRAEEFLDGLATISAKKGSEAASKKRSIHAGVVAIAYGEAENSRMTLVGLGIITDKRLMQEYSKWIQGLPIDEKLLPKVKEFSRKVGLNASFLEDDLFDTAMFLPKATMDRMMDSLARSMVKSSSGNVNDLFTQVVRYFKVKMIRGVWILKPRYFTMNTIDHFTQIFMTAGLQPAIRSTAKLLPQNIATHPLVSVPLTIAVQFGLDAKKAENLRRGLQRMGDSLSRAVSSRAASMDTNAILNGSEDVVRVADSFYTGKDIRRIAVEEGIFSSFDTRELERILDLKNRAFFEENAPQGFLQRTLRMLGKDIPNFTADMAETWSERERMGAMLTFMEMGLSPRDSARMAIKSLYDYAGSSTKSERNRIFQLIYPFWTYQKNANAHVFDMMFSPWGAYRLGIMRRAHEGSTDLLTYALYEGVVDPYGVDAESLRQMPQEEYQWYFMTRKVIEFGYGSLDSIDPVTRQSLESSFGPLDDLDEETKNFIENGFGGPEKVPKDVRDALRMVTRGRSQAYEEGKSIELETDFYEAAMQRGVSLESFVAPKPSKSNRRFYQRELSGVVITRRATELVREYYGSMDPAQEYPYTEIFLPESTIHAGFKHISGIVALSILGGTAAATVAKNTVERGIGARGEPQFSVEDEVGQFDIFNRAFANLASEMAPVDRGFIIGEVLAAADMTSSTYKRVDPSIVGLIQSLGIPVTKREAATDTLHETALRDQGFTEEQIKALSKSGEDRYYIPPGLVSMAYQMAPMLVELNNVALMMKISDAATVSTLQERLIERAARIAGLSVDEVSQTVTAQREEPRFKSTTRTPR